MTDAPQSDDVTEPPTERAASIQENGEWDVPGSNAVDRCDRCGRPFARSEWLDLHRGLAHPDDLSDDEIDAFRTAYDDEEDDIRLFRLKALGVLVLLYFGLLIVYALL